MKKILLYLGAIVFIANKQSFGNVVDDIYNKLPIEVKTRPQIKESIQSWLNNFTQVAIPEDLSFIDAKGYINPIKLDTIEDVGWQLFEESEEYESCKEECRATDYTEKDQQNFDLYCAICDQREANEQYERSLRDDSEEQQLSNEGKEEHFSRLKEYNDLAEAGCYNNPSYKFSK